CGIETRGRLPGRDGGLRGPRCPAGARAGLGQPESAATRAGRGGPATRGWPGRPGTDPELVRLARAAAGGVTAAAAARLRAGEGRRAPPADRTGAGRTREGPARAGRNRRYPVRRDKRGRI